MARILVVDDHDLVRLALAFLLRSEGYEVDLAADGTQALERQATSPFDVILLDVYMPQMDGLEACRELRQRSQVPILMFSTNSDPLVQEQAIACGANAFMPKPMELEHLLAWVRNLSVGVGHIVRNSLAYSYC